MSLFDRPDVPARRRRIKVQGAFDSGLADHIATLWQGGYPIFGDLLRRQGVEVLALCARELQPRTIEEGRELFPGVDVLLAPMDDLESGPTRNEQVVAALAAHKVAGAARLGKRVLVTCAMGLNRSSLVTAMALIILGGLTGAQAVAHVRRNRSGTLTNKGFVRFLEKVRK